MNGPAPSPSPVRDNRTAQIERVANCLRQSPGLTAKQLDALADTGCIRKVLSEMMRRGYGFAREWCLVPCNGGRGLREVKTYRLLYTPSDQPDLFNQTSEPL
jgi:hypothetical protein